MFMNLNLYSSVKNNNFLISRVTTYFGLKSLSSGHHYKEFRIRSNAVIFMLVTWAPI